jgi:hypothetical protein
MLADAMGEDSEEVRKAARRVRWRSQIVDDYHPMDAPAFQPPQEER